ncbi:hypothetical protein JI735_28265 [Paenibacillus sonchi]|uniref:Adhesin domain-containing protein n=1 Tax=Paenibacillus sonchi TaxID=373687 RepID=A0A974PAC9_9BACL|nr:hypothetical protein [Paenibacillus sonchi]QQZ60364.1 hypothetical protein JI735_28265 [Paenibacillus sonchi]
MNRNHNIAKLAAVAVLSIAMLSGCRELPGKEAADNQLEQRLTGNSHQETAETFKQGLSEVTSNVEQAVKNTAAKVTDEINSVSMSKELVTSRKADSSSAIILENSVGEVKVTSGSSDSITVKATVVTHLGLNKETERKILDNAEVTVQADGDELKVSTHAKNEPQKNLWAWAQKKYGASNFTIDYEIEVPATIDEYDISNNVGAIQLKGLQGTFHIASDVGAIVMDNARFSGNSTVESNTGSIELDIRGMKTGSSLKASSDIGKVTAGLEDSLKCTVSAKTELGHITGTGSGSTDINGGGPLVSLSTQIGSITVQ